MSILRSLQIGVSGLRSNSEALSVAGDNIANVNTVGFKKSRAVFQDMLGRSISSTSTESGAGSRLAHIEQMWSQGALVTTDSPTDLAISGEGLFVVEGQMQGSVGRYYTRAGQFHIDSNGILVNSDGMRLQGYTANPDGSIGSTIGDLVVSPGSTVPANPTTEVSIAANLDADEGTTPLPAFDPTDPEGTSNFSNNVTVYDSLGAAHEITIFYRASGPGNWEWHAMVDGGEIGGTPGTPTEGASGTLTFTTAGELDTETSAASSWSFNNATPAQAIAFDFGNSITTDGGTGIDGTTQYASPSTTNGLTQDGYAAGSVAGIAIAGDGTITGVFSNGQNRPLGQVATARFTNNEGLARTGNGLWLETQDSGEALIGVPETGGRGSIVSGTLEQANVDLGTEFVNLIAYQRGFQANSRVITTSDEMYGELVNIKR